MATSGSLVAIITRIPEPGRSKTRLIPLLGESSAADLQRRMTEHVVRQARILRAREDSVAIVAVTEGSVSAGRRWLGVPCVAQGEGGLGARLARVFEAGARRARVTTVVGGDCVTVNANDLRVAQQHAERHLATIVPAEDGGFCALALHESVASDARGLLEGIDWGSATVCEQTVARLRQRCPDLVVMDARADVDVPEDLPIWERIRRAWYEPPQTVAVVVPVLDDAEELATLLPTLAAHSVEVVIADGGSGDDTVAVARAAGAAVIASPRGRGVQMNAAAPATQADALLFVHSDTRPPEGFAQLVLDALADASVSIGAFNFSTDSASPGMRVIERGVRLRGSVFGMPYGDQGLFCRRAVFEALGGFPAFPVMEDYEYVRRARRIGRVAVLPQRAVTSARRWHEQGVWRWSALNLATVARYHLGATPDDLARWRVAHSKR